MKKNSRNPDRNCPLTDHALLHQTLPEAYMVERSTEEIYRLLHWTAEQLNAPEPLEFALGVWATLMWLSGDEYVTNPADYKGPFTVANVSAQAKALENLHRRSRAESDELIRKAFG